MKTKSKTYLVFIVLVLAGLSYFFYFKQAKDAKAPIKEIAVNEQANLQDQNQKNTEVKTEVSAQATGTKPGIQTKTDLGQGTFSDGSEMDAPPSDILVTEVSFDGKAFSPQTLNIKVGDIVIFKNNSSESFWPASSPHPEHTDYPEFDSKAPILSGGKWQFTFTKPGNWKYHDHLNLSAFGIINVVK